jgi:hypothetical protein
MTRQDRIESIDTGSAAWTVDRSAIGPAIL